MSTFYFSFLIISDLHFSLTEYILYFKIQKSITDLYMHRSFVDSSEHEDLSALYLDLSCMNEDCLPNLSEWFALRRLCKFMMKFR
eukprot:CAMPEP_0119511060 /NCGR_PEP_ID=MMETSP1344-20130328/29836_1 /TAXON_ID=236787 /ORGANISM="Florenciella parvula, Strain CCMP2471" /LENGTH=84 /DNA_ID=CAMNT_0007548025 /DNA_START=56 /DNA_END=306 /DNA_ORIENTATION=-